MDRLAHDDTLAVSFASSPAIRRKMQAQRSRDTKVELEIRRLLYAMGFRYRVDRAPIPGLRRRADIVFSRAKVAVYVDGCFWHACPKHGTWPRKNAEWWQAKLLRNRRRDAETDCLLESSGWHVVRVWEHEPPQDAANRIVVALDST